MPLLKRTIWTVATLLVGLGLAETFLTTLVVGNGDVVEWQRRTDDVRCVAPRAGTTTNYTGSTLKTDPVRHTINAQGFRNLDGGATKTGSKGHFTKIAVMGSAIVFGQGVEDNATIPARLGGILDPDGDKSVEVMNFGVPGYNIKESVDQYVHLARTMHPDMAVLFVTQDDGRAPLCAKAQNGISWWFYWHSSAFRVMYDAMTPLIDFVMPPDEGLPPATLVRRELTRFAKSAGEDGVRPFVVLVGDPGEQNGEGEPGIESALGELNIPYLPAQAWVDPSNLDGFLPRTPELTSFSAQGNDRAANALAKWLIETSRALKPPYHKNDPDNLCVDIRTALFNRLDGFKTVATQSDGQGLHLIMERDAQPRHLLLAIGVHNGSLYTFQTLRGEGDQSLADSPVGRTLGDIFESMGQSSAIMNCADLNVKEQPKAENSFTILDKMYRDLFAPPRDNSQPTQQKVPMTAIAVIVMLAVAGLTLTTWLISSRIGTRPKE